MNHDATRRMSDNIKRTMEIVDIEYPEGSTPMTLAETLVRSCPDSEWIEEIIYWLTAFLTLCKGGDEK